MRMDARGAACSRAFVAAIVAQASCARDGELESHAAAPAEAAAAAAPVEVETPRPGDPARAAPHVAAARAAIAAVDRAGARRELDLALAADPACVEALEQLGWFLLDPAPGQDPGAALLCFLRLRRLGAAGVVVSAGEGVARAASGDGAGARPLLDAAAGSPELQSDPARRAKVEFALGLLDGDDGRAADAIVHVARVLELEPVPAFRAEPLVALGELLIGSSKPEEGEMRLREAIAADPEHVKARYVLSRLLQRLGRADEAQRQMRVHDLLERILSPERRPGPDAAAEQAEMRAQLLAAEPDCRAFRSGWLRALLEARRYDEASREIAQLARREPPTAELAFLLARARAGLGDLAGAEKSRALMRKLDPKVPATLDRVILEEWRRGVPAVSDDQIEGVLLQWSRR